MDEALTRGMIQAAHDIRDRVDGYLTDQLSKVSVAEYRAALVGLLAENEKLAMVARSWKEIPSMSRDCLRCQILSVASRSPN